MLLRTLLLSVLLVGCVQVGYATALTVVDDELAQVVFDVCQRDVILLGEDNHHGSGRTLEVKRELVQRLVRECEFDQVLFESSFDEFVGFNRALAAGDATQAQLADAVGGIWADATEMQPLLAWLFDAAKAGKVEVGGIDPASGSRTGRWTRRVLGGELTQFVPREKRAECKATIDRNEAWAYDDTHPYDDAEQSRLAACAGWVRKTLAKRIDVQDETTEMARAYSVFVQAQLEQYAQVANNVRDKGMHELLDWHRLRGHHKTIVWCATVHAAKTLDGKRIPMGQYLHAELSEQMAAIGFTAVAGSYGGTTTHWQAMPLPAAQPGSIEAIIVPSPPEGLRYLNKTSLLSLGVVSARALDYTKPQALGWAGIVDGLIVLDAEKPQTK